MYLSLFVMKQYASLNIYDVIIKIFSKIGRY